MLQPIESIDCLFIRSFCEEDTDFDSDLPLMMQDYLFHEGEKILEYSGCIYADDCFENSGALNGLRYKFLNVLLAAARHGSEFSAEMLCRIYKIYYRREYNQLKRFKTLSAGELEAFDNEEELFATTASRILTIAPFMGIDVNPDCGFVRHDIEDILEDKTFGYKHEPDWLEFKDGVFEKTNEEAQEVLNRFKKANPDYFFENPVQEFLWAVFRYNGVPSDFDILCEVDFEPEKREYAVTLSLLRTIWPKKTFSDQELLFYHGIYRTMSILINHLCLLDENIDLMLGRYDKFQLSLEHSLYRPAGKNAAKVVRVVSDKTDNNLADAQTSAEKQPSGMNEKLEELYKENEQLRASIRAKDQTIGQLNRMYRDAAEREKQNRIDQEAADSDREELSKMREYLYSLTETDLKKTGVSLSAMEQELVQRKIAIVGGHDNWVGFLREKFPDWTYIKPGAVNTVPENAIMKAEYLFFFTDTISHGAYNKFLKVVRTHKIPYGYLHGTNIPMTVQQIYNTVMHE